MVGRLDIVIIIRVIVRFRLFRWMREGRVTWARRFAVAPVEECEGERGTPESYVKIGKLLATARLPIVEPHAPKVNQKKTAPAFLVLHQPPRPFWNDSPSDACGSLVGSLHPGSVQADIVVMNLHDITTMSYLRAVRLIKTSRRTQ